MLFLCCGRRGEGATVRETDRQRQRDRGLNRHSDDATDAEGRDTEMEMHGVPSLSLCLSVCLSVI